MLGVGIIGSGFIGKKRAGVLKAAGNARLVACADSDLARAQALANEYGAEASADWQQLLRRSDVDAVIVATTHQWLGPISLAALQAGKHVLCEKPLALTAEEAERLVSTAASQNLKLKTGFNHRHHPAVWEAHSRASAGEIGPLMYIRCRYGHGGRKGYDQEWRADAAQSGGGELQDQGAHALDLFRWFLGDFSEIYAVLTTSFWKMSVEDNAFCTLRTESGQVATLHASWTQWKNIFSFEIFGETGYLLVEGLGGSYGPERLVIGHRPAEFGKPDEVTKTFDQTDVSWAEEWQEFVTAIAENRSPLASGYDGWQVLRMVQAANESSQSHRAVRL